MTPWQLFLHLAAKPSPNRQRVCPICKATFDHEPKSNAKLYCSDPCREKANDLQRRIREGHSTRRVPKAFQALAGFRNLYVSTL